MFFRRKGTFLVRLGDCFAIDELVTHYTSGAKFLGTPFPLASGGIHFGGAAWRIPFGRQGLLFNKAAEAGGLARVVVGEHK